MVGGGRTLTLSLTESSQTQPVGRGWMSSSRQSEALSSSLQTTSIPSVEYLRKRNSIASC